MFGRPHLCDKVKPVVAAGPTSHALQMAALLPPAVLASGALVARSTPPISLDRFSSNVAGLSAALPRHIAAAAAAAIWVAASSMLHCYCLCQGAASLWLHPPSAIALHL